MGIGNKLLVSGDVLGTAANSFQGHRYVAGKPNALQVPKAARVHLRTFLFHDVLPRPVFTTFSEPIKAERDAGVSFVGSGHVEELLQAPVKYFG